MDGYLLKSFIMEFFLLGSILAILLYNASIISINTYNFPLLDKETYLQSLFVLFICIILSLNTDFGSFSSLSLFANDITSISLKTLILIAITGSLICGKPYFLSKQLNLFEYYVLVLLALFSLLFLTSSTDLISIYLCLEMQSLCFYVLAAFNRYSIYSTEAGLKYFVLGAFSSCLFLLGSSIIYGLTGTTNLANLALLLTDLNIANINFSILFFSIIFLLVTILFKLTAAPFHIWSPDVYEGSPLNSTIIFILVPKTVFLLLILRLFYSSFFPFFFAFKSIFIFCGILSVLIGSILALQQKRLKRLLIYSSISHVGFILLAFSTGTILGATAVFYYIIFYIITGFLIWGIISVIYANTKKTIYLTDFSMLIKTNPAIAIALALGFFSFAGIPPLIGFSMKFFVFSAAIEAQMFEISLIIILLSVLGSFYYLRFIKILFFEKQEKFEFFITDSKNTEFTLLLASFSLFVICFGFIDPTLFLLYSYKVVLGLMIL